MRGMVTARPSFTEPEYLALERASSTKHEFINGLILAMAGGDPVHNLVCSNALRALGALADKRGCLVFTSDQRVHVQATGAYVYPDVTVVCGRPERHAEDAQALVNPAIIVEVISPSTEDHDRGAKGRHYRRIPSLEHLLVIEPRERSVEHHRRTGPSRWEVVEATADDAIALFDGQLMLRDLFANIDAVAAKP